YNGPKGFAELKRDQALDAVGKAPEKYQRYKEADKQFNFLSRQVRQFYGDSIQPSAMDALEAKLDPRGAFKSVETGKNSYNSMRNLLGKELKTYRDAIKGTDVYRGTEQSGI